ncbi:type VII secretion target [Glycomyces sp. L485]|uniref:type VII secretion target n=1 Tax=Glycomyces sp. L485 TaxID=2909235 RepID=UPI001F4A55BC|nr:type VII secretion target [Glycomyces sp. L485]MCH7229371.1 type VII secretion target [Glycomyces sp. L485]
MSSIDIDAAQLRAAATSLRGVSAEAASLADYAQEADPDWWTWGLGGLAFAAAYFYIAESHVHPAFKEAVDAIEGLAASLEKCADDHEGNDEEIAGDLARIADELETGGA